MFTVLIRTVVLYFLVLFTIRVMGKRQIGQLEPFELVITIMISELASMPMQDTRIPLVHSIIPIVTLSLLQAVITFLEIKSRKAQILFTGKPSILIRNGNIDINELTLQKFSIDDLLEELRLKGYYNIDDIEFAILETSGQISIIPKPECEPPTKKDLNIKPRKVQYPVALIRDGKINHDNLRVSGKDVAWLKNMLSKNKIDSPKEVFIAFLNSNNEFSFQLKPRRKNKI